MLFNQSYKEISNTICLVIGEPHDFTNDEKGHGCKQVHKVNVGHLISDAHN